MLWGLSNEIEAVRRSSVNRSFGRRGGISTKGDTRLFVPDQETFTLECGSVESMNLYAEIRTLAGIPLLIFVARYNQIHEFSKFTHLRC